MERNILLEQKRLCQSSAFEHFIVRAQKFKTGRDDRFDYIFKNLIDAESHDDYTLKFVGSLENQKKKVLRFIRIALTFFIKSEKRLHNKLHLKILRQKLEMANCSSEFYEIIEEGLEITHYLVEQKRC